MKNVINVHKCNNSRRLTSIISIVKNNTNSFKNYRSKLFEHYYKMFSPFVSNLQESFRLFEHPANEESLEQTKISIKTIQPLKKE